MEVNNNMYTGQIKRKTSSATSSDSISMIATYNYFTRLQPVTGLFLIY